MRNLRKVWQIITKVVDTSFRWKGSACTLLGPISVSLELSSWPSMGSTNSMPYFSHTITPDMTRPWPKLHLYAVHPSQRTSLLLNSHTMASNPISDMLYGKLHLPWPSMHSTLLSLHIFCYIHLPWPPMASTPLSDILYGKLHLPWPPMVSTLLNVT